VQRQWTRRRALHTLLALAPMLAGCTVSGSVQQQRAQELTNATATPTAAVSSASPNATGGPGTPVAATTTAGATVQPTFTPGGQVALRFGAAGLAPELDAYAAIATAYSKATPNTTVTVERLPGDGVSSLAQALAAGAAPDVITLPWQQLAPWSGQGMLDDLTALLGATVLDTSGDFTNLQQYGTMGGRTEALPLSFNPRVLYVNLDLLGAAGLAAPGLTFDWQAFETAATRMSDGATRTGFATDAAPFDWLPWVWAAGGSVFDNELDPTACALSGDASVSGLQRFADLWLQHRGANAPGATSSVSTPLDGFLAGNVGMVAGDRSSQAALQQAKFKWQVTYLPQGPGGHATTYDATFAAVTKSSRQPLVAGKLLSFLATAQDAQLLLAKSGVVVPARIAAATSPEMKPAGSAVDDTVYTKTLLFAYDPPRTSAWSQIQAAWEPELQQLWAGKRNAADTAKVVVSKVNDALHALAATPTAAPFAIQLPATPTPAPSPGAPVPAASPGASPAASASPTVLPTPTQ